MFQGDSNRMSVRTKVRKVFAQEFCHAELITA